MSDPTTDPAMWVLVKAVGGWVMAAALALFGWLGKRHISRLDKIEAEYVRRDVFDKTVLELRDEIRTGNRETHRRLDELMLLQAKRERTN